MSSESAPMTDTKTDLVERLREGPIRTGDTEDGEYELFDIEEATQTMLEAASRLQSLKAERDALASQVQRMEYSDGDAEHWKFLAERAEAENATLKGEVAALLNAYGRTVLAALEAKP